MDAQDLQRTWNENMQLRKTLLQEVQEGQRTTLNMVQSDITQLQWFMGQVLILLAKQDGQ